MVMTEQKISQLARFKRSRALAVGGILATIMAVCCCALHAQTAPPNNVQATSAGMNSPAGIAYDAAGNLYIADLNDNVIREVSLAGIVTTVAGTGEQGFGGDGGAATSAILDSPAGVTVDSTGNIYIADTRNNRIRKISGGTISTIAGTGVAGFSGDGGLATAATLDRPTALAMDAAGNLYIADTENHRIRKFTGTTITTVAGDGEQLFSGDGAAATVAGLDSPNGVAVDAAGNIYIGDTNNQRIRVVNPAGIISTLAGNSSKSYAGDGGPAAAASLARPRGLSVDASGNIYVADSDNNRIRLIASGKISTAAGNGSQGFAGDGGPAINAELNSPRAPAVQAAGTFAFSDTGNQLVREVRPDAVIHTVAGTVGNQGVAETLILSGPSVVAFGGGSLTATIRNASLTATGSVSLLDISGTSTSVGSAGLTNNLATFSTAALSPGFHRLVASYGGDALNAPITSSLFVVTVTAPSITDFTLVATGATTLYVNPGRTATFNFSLQPQGGVFNTPITFTVSGLPAGATAVFTPTSIASGAGASSVNLVISTPAQQVTNHPPISPFRGPLAPLSAALFSFPLLWNSRVHRRFGTMPRALQTVLLLLTAGAATIGLTGCGNGGYFVQSQHSYTIAVTATATSSANTTLQHTTSVTLIVQ
jgi:hypothetical protein